MNIDQLVYKLLEITLVLVRKSLKFLLLRNQVPVVGYITLRYSTLEYNGDDLDEKWQNREKIHIEEL
jgi:hypothetical protein